ncbi:MAG TPA: hypothetical protein VFK57_25615 [Vicinamibacterales bacterium]|nr:hypothetical protein [Vicinamibacterales bacterium]
MRVLVAAALMRWMEALGMAQRARPIRLRVRAEQIGDSTGAIEQLAEM